MYSPAEKRLTNSRVKTMFKNETLSNRINETKKYTVTSLSKKNDRKSEIGYRCEEKEFDDRCKT